LSFFVYIKSRKKCVCIKKSISRAVKTSGNLRVRHFMRFPSLKLTQRQKVWRARRHLEISHGKRSRRKKRRAFFFSRTAKVLFASRAHQRRSDHCLWRCKISASLDLEPAARALYFMCVAETIMLPDVCLKLVSTKEIAHHQCV
jgi:hypothetical protein